MAKLIKAKMMNTQNPTAEIRYGMIVFTMPPATENATTASAVPLARVARGKHSVGYTQLEHLSQQRLDRDSTTYQVVSHVLP
jgi:hypothetical protein